MSRKNSKRVIEDEDNDTSNEESNEGRGEEVNEHLGISLEEFERTLRKLFMTKEMYKWLKKNEPYIQFMRELVLGILDEVGIDTSIKYKAANHPVWSRVTPQQRRRGFRENPGLGGHHPLKQWLKSQRIEDAPETAIKFVSQTWRRFRNSLKKLIMADVFSYPWGTEEDPVKSGPDLEAYLNTDEGDEQLKQWIVEEYLRVSPDASYMTEAPEALHAWIKAMFIYLRNQYANVKEMEQGEAKARKEEEGRELDEELRREYKEDREDEAEDDELERPKKKKTKGKKNNKNSPVARKQVRVDPDPVSKKTNKSQAYSSSLTASTSKSEASRSLSTKAASAKENSSASTSLVQRLLSGSLVEQTKSNSKEKDKKDYRRSDYSDPAPRAPATQITKPRAKPPPTPQDDDDEDLAALVAATEMEDDAPKKPTPARKQREKEKKGEKVPKTTSEAEQVRSCRSTRQTSLSESTNTNQPKSKKRNASDADLTRSKSPERKKQKSLQKTPVRI